MQQYITVCLLLDFEVLYWILFPFVAHLYANIYRDGNIP